MSDRGDATANGAVAGAGMAAAYMTAARYASYGARIGAVGGAFGIIGGALVGGALGFLAYEVGSVKNK